MNLGITWFHCQRECAAAAQGARVGDKRAAVDPQLLVAAAECGEFACSVQVSE